MTRDWSDLTPGEKRQILNTQWLCLDSKNFQSEADKIEMRRLEQRMAEYEAEMRAAVFGSAGGMTANALRALADAVAAYILAIDDMMKKPPTYGRGQQQAALVNDLQRAHDKARAVLKLAEES